MFIVINRSKIIACIVSFLSVFVLFFATANLDNKQKEIILETSANIVEDQNLLITNKKDITNEDDNTININFEI